MHACLNVDEIVRFIASELVASKAKTTAVALACCRKNFEDPVLDTLWETQDRLLPLLKSFPGGVWNKGGCTSFKRLPTTLEWARFRKYTRRIRKLTISGIGNKLPSEVLPVLQLCITDGPLFPNLKTLELSHVTGNIIPFIRLFHSPRITAIDITFIGSGLPNAVVASMVTALPVLSPNLQGIALHNLPRDPMITAAISRMLLASNKDALRSLNVDSPLTEEALEVIHKLPSLCKLWVVVERGTSLPPLVLPNLTHLLIKNVHDGDWLRMFHGATLGELEGITIFSGFEPMGNFLEAFERAALAVSVQKTLSEFTLHTEHSWTQNYSSLLPFTQLTYIDIDFPCGDICSSRVDDGVVTNLARAMPKLETLHLGEGACSKILAGVTVIGLVFLARHCLDLKDLRIHFQVDSLSDVRTTAWMTCPAASTAPRRDCALRVLQVGEIPLPEESVLVVALTLLRIFPHIECIDYNDDSGWHKVEGAILTSRNIIDCSEATVIDRETVQQGTI